MTTFAERLRQLVSFDDAGLAGRKATYKRETRNEAGEVILLIAYPQVFPLMHSTDSINAQGLGVTEQFCAHWVSAEDLIFTESLSLSGAGFIETENEEFLPMEGDTFSYLFDTFTERHFTVEGFAYDDESPILIRIEATPTMIRSPEDSALSSRTNHPLGDLNCLTIETIHAPLAGDTGSTGHNFNPKGKKLR